MSFVPFYGTTNLLERARPLRQALRKANDRRDRVLRLEGRSLA